VSLNEWQIGEIRKAIAEADRGDFATDKQVPHSLKRLRKKKSIRNCSP
jgi:predicted transcriptional regulator